MVRRVSVALSALPALLLLAAGAALAQEAPPPSGETPEPEGSAVQREVDRLAKEAGAKEAAAKERGEPLRLPEVFVNGTASPAGVPEVPLDHPLVGTLARRLVWTFRSNGDARAAIWSGGRLVDAGDRELDVPGGSEVELWHPIGRAVDDVIAWRRWIEAHEIRQPFKQAHREIYLLTDAERQTRTYSNRFAAHVLRQHQYHALCAARGWKNRLRLMVDDAYPPTCRDLVPWGLRAEYWVEGAGTAYGTDTNESATPP